MFSVKQLKKTCFKHIGCLRILCKKTVALPVVVFAVLGGLVFVQVMHEESISQPLELSKKDQKSCGPVSLSARDFPATTLVSFPGSGNTWLRFLIQEATGIFTGSEYNDKKLRTHGFLGEGVANSSTILVKTHKCDAATLKRYEKAVLLIRHPYEAIKAEFNRKCNGGNTSEDKIESLEKYWPEYYSKHQMYWVRFHEVWQAYRRPLLVVMYKDLVQQTNVKLREILTFLKVHIHEERLNCAIANGNATRRPTSLLHLPHMINNNQSAEAVFQHVINVFNISSPPKVEQADDVADNAKNREDLDHDTPFMRATLSTKVGRLDGQFGLRP
ncbi:WSCD family member CG9164-like [Physella acuta]|uniref:WSCD family member CG9164-like n=1 Tax=Physella acuta TaxID=109671 RepID=UPI0027DC0B98|nr:WSCD family member CG9164-like [Physella acuta]